MGVKSEGTDLRTRNVRAMQAVLQALPDAVQVPEPDQGFTYAYYRQYGYIKPEGLESGRTRDRIIEDIVAQGYPAFHASCSEACLEKAFNGTGWRSEPRLPVARELGETSIMLLTHPFITEEQLEGHCSAVRHSFEKAAR